MLAFRTQEKSFSISYYVKLKDYTIFTDFVIENEIVKTKITQYYVHLKPVEQDGPFTPETLI